jgi:F420-non-reducing hydrogenase iron-sulfur subunit
VRQLLSYVGINPERLRLEWVSSAEAPRFVEVTKKFAETIQALGPISREVPE